jgi:hypothetical protein
MTKRSFSQEELHKLNHLKETEQTRKPDKKSREQPSTANRADLLPGTEVMPGRGKLVQGINTRRIFGWLILFIILGLIWYSLSGPGRSILEKQLAGMSGRNNTSAVSILPTQTEISTILPLASNTPLPSTTIRPTLTTTLVSIATSTPTKVLASTATPTKTSILMSVATLKLPSTSIPTSSPTSIHGQETSTILGCVNALTITLADVGKSLCVQGTVIETLDKPSFFMVLFSYEKGAFYWVTYDMVWSRGKIDTCYQITGKIDRIGNSPMLVFNYDNLPKECQ